MSSWPCWAHRRVPPTLPGASSPRRRGCRATRWQILFPAPEVADAWMRKPNAAPLFGGRSALQRMLAGNVSDLNAVRRYLDGVRGGGWS
jgi:hypothetical protein